MAFPVTKEASLEDSHRTAAAISSGVPMRPMGSWSRIALLPSVVVPKTRSIMWVSMMPGQMALMRMPELA